MKSTESYRKFRDYQLTDNRVKKEYDLLEKDFSLAREIIQLRKELNLTQEELAKKVGTSQPAIARVESGNYRNISLSFLRKVAKALGTEPEIHLRKVLEL